MKKRILPLLFASAVAAGALSGCGTSTSAATNAASAEASGEAAKTSTVTIATEVEATGTLKDILDRGYMTVATEPYFAPNEFIDPSKQGEEQYVGADIELAKYIAEKLGVECRIVPLEFSAVLSSVQEGKYDMAISALAYTPAREEAVNLSKGYHFTQDEGYGLMVRKEDAGSINSAEDLSDKVVVVQSGSLQEAIYNDQVKNSKELKRVSATTDGYLMVQEGKADAVVVSISNAGLYIEANKDCGLEIVKDFKFELDEKYDGTRIGIKKGEEALTTVVNEIIDELLENGEYAKWYEDYEKYAAELGL